ncbi:histidine kinase [Paenarthrobacter nitroguajacolicus]|uniref:sensor histidine kinase n=1 Tax=Paenarthrobacter nitroguajacolicus TaxID=211146 RepID=UPI002854BA94|nr:histidine kinase [Paenarthrobacter nitroguajacolicus]MDR6638612.1 signal transduction histidine kinase [Paenarthrobacter nitroguajacolicus]
MTEALQTKDASAASADASFAEIAQRRRGRIRRYFFKHPRAMDAVVVLCYVLLALPTIITSVIDSKWFVVALLLMIAIALVFRRHFPLPVVAAVALLEVAATILNPWGSNVSVGLWFALYALASLKRRAVALVVFAVASLPLSLLYLFMWTSPSQMNTLQDVPENFHLINNIATAITIMLSNLLATGIGISVRQRREHEGEIAAWAARTTQLGKVTERNRIAREMHDVVAHSLTVMISLSDGAAVVVKKDPERAGEVLNELSRTGRAALADMRRVLGVLRDDSGRPAPLAPLESGHNLANLLEGFRTAGLPLHYAHTGPGLPSDPAFQLTVYRIVQESLTNVLRYGRALSRVDVQVSRDGDLVTINVNDDGRGTHEGGSEFAGSLGTGQGIAGMNERAGIYAGIVTAGPGKRGGWAVHAELRWNGDKGES